MPTGYTYKIEKGCTFEEYLWGCVRAMGACIMMRDDPSDAVIPEAFEPSTYYKDQAEDHAKELAAIDTLSGDEIMAKQIADNARIRAQNEEWRIRDVELKVKYESMLKQVKAWSPPTADHKGLKDFMIQQIDISMPRGDGYSIKENPIISVEAWREKERSNIREKLARHQNEWNKELERTNGRNGWIKALRESVPQLVAKKEA